MKMVIECASYNARPLEDGRDRGGFVAIFGEQRPLSVKSAARVSSIDFPVFPQK